jgi:hypothetical protein
VSKAQIKTRRMRRHNDAPANWQFRAGRPRWIPSPALRKAGWRARDLKDAAGTFLSEGLSRDAARAINAAVAAWRAGEPVDAAFASIAPEGAGVASDGALPQAVDRLSIGRLIDAYNAQRVGAATVALGIAAGAHRHAVERAQSRRQFGRPIGEFQGLAWMVADMGIAVEAARAMIHRAARSAGPAGFPERIAAAQAKILASETAIRVTNDALQVWGAAGYSRDNPLERMVRDARMFAIAGGTAQVLRNLVAESMLGLRLPLRPEGAARLAAE